MSHKRNFYNRRFSIKRQNTFIYGACGSGKSTLALSFSQNFERVAFVDCNLLFSQKMIEKELQRIESCIDDLELIIIDNYKSHGSFDFIFGRKNLQIIIISRNKNMLDSIRYKKDFVELKVLPISFEEYLSIDKKNLNVESLLSNYLRDGNSVEMLHLPEFKKREHKFKMLKDALDSNLPFFLHILGFQAKKN